MVIPYHGLDRGLRWFFGGGFLIFTPLLVLGAWLPCSNGGDIGCGRSRILGWNVGKDVLCVFSSDCCRRIRESRTKQLSIMEYPRVTLSSTGPWAEGPGTIGRWTSLLPRNTILEPPLLPSSIPMVKSAQSVPQNITNLQSRRSGPNPRRCRELLWQFGQEYPETTVF